jgi:hypothetical protein
VSAVTAIFLPPFLPFHLFYLFLFLFLPPAKSSFTNSGFLSAFPQFSNFSLLHQILPIPLTRWCFEAEFIMDYSPMNSAEGRLSQIGKKKGNGANLCAGGAILTHQQMTQ